MAKFHPRRCVCTGNSPEENTADRKAGNGQNKNSRNNLWTWKLSGVTGSQAKRVDIGCGSFSRLRQPLPIAVGVSNDTRVRVHQGFGTRAFSRMNVCVRTYNAAEQQGCDSKQVLGSIQHCLFVLAP